MKLGKRLLSIALTIVMVMTMVVVPVSAAEVFTVSVSSTTANEGATGITLNLNIANNPGFTALGVNVYYKADVLTCTAMESTESKLMDSVNPDNSNCSSERTAAGWKMASFGYMTTKAYTDNGSIGTLTFAVTGGLESCEALIEVEIDSATKADGLTDFGTNEIQTANGKITINGVAPTLEEVKLDNSTVQVDGTKDVTVQASAASAKGTDLTGSVTWSVSPAGQGVSINGGKITVEKNAKADAYTITATPGAGVQGNAIKKTLTVTREAEKAASIEISGGVSTITLPGKPFNAETNTFSDTPVNVYYENTAFVATVTNQYGETMKDPNVTWSMVSGSSGEQYRDKDTHKLCADSGTHANCEKYSFDGTTGLEISESGHLLVTSACKTGTVKFSATCGDYTKTATVTIEKANSQATKITISGDATELTIPDDQATSNATAVFTAEVKDQYDTTMSDDVTWSIAPVMTGVSIENGKLTVTNAAKSGIASSQTFTVTAACGGKSDTKTVTVKRAGSVATSLEVYRGTTKLGTDDTVTIPTGDKANEYEYSAKVLDQYGAGMVATVNLSMNTGYVTGVTFNNGVLTVANNATKGDTCQLNVSYNGLIYNVTITLKDIDITWPTATANGTYGQTWDQIVAFDNDGSAMLNGTEVEGTFALAKGSTVPNVGDKYQLVFTSADGVYSVTSEGKEATIAKAKLTVTADDQNITFGEDTPKFTAKYVGFVNGDTVSSVFSDDPTFECEYTKGAGKGTYTIEVKDLTASNYEITVAPGTLTVSAKALDKSMVEAIDDQTYTGKAQTPEVTVKDGKALTKGTDFTVSYSSNLNAGTATATITGIGNYSGTVDKTFTIAPATLTITGATFADKTFDDSDKATVTGVSFSGLVNGETLALGTDYTATGKFAQKTVGESVSASVTVTLNAQNYQLASATMENAGSAKISPVTTTLSLTAANAAYTGAAYAESNITKTSNVETAPAYTYYADNDGVKGSALTGAPAAVGTYWVSGYIAASGNNSEVTSEAVKFQITRAALTVTAEDKGVIYGDAAPAYTATYTGLVKGDDASVVSGLTFECGYAQYNNVGTYAIAPKGATAANYDITLVPGTLTVEQKTVTLTWSADALYYDGTAKTVTATPDGLVNGDAVSVTVVGNTQTDIGSYTATATGLTGEKAGNYSVTLPATHDFEIGAALESVTVSPETVTGVIDGLTIKLTGYTEGAASVSINGEEIPADGKLTFNGVAYTVDASGVGVLPSGLTITETTSAISFVDDYVLSGGAESKGLSAAAYQSILAAVNANTAITQADITLNIEATSLEDDRLTLTLTPVVTYRDAESNEVGDADQAIALNAPVTVTMPLPTGMSAPMFAKVGSKVLEVSVSGGSMTWTQTDFPATAVLYEDIRSAEVAFVKEDGSILNKTLTPADIGTALPTDSKSGKTFSGWSFDGVSGTFKTLTEELMTSLNGQSVTATPVFTTSGGSSGGGSSSGSHHSGSSSSPSKFKVSVGKSSNGSVTVSASSAKKGDTVTITVDPAKGYTLETLTVLDKNGKELKLTAKKNGKYTFTMPSGKVTVNATFMEDNTMLNFFVDVPVEMYYYDPVLWAVSNGITLGRTETTFCPDDVCSKANIITFMWRAAGSPAPSIANPFADVDESSDYFAQAAIWAYENGIISGTAFEGGTPCTRAMTMEYFWKQAGSPATAVNGQLTDVAADATYAQAVAWGVAQGITTGVTETTFVPDKTCTRGQIVTFLYRAYQGQ